MLPFDSKVLPGAGKDIASADAEAGLIVGIERLNGPLRIFQREERRDRGPAEVVGAGL